MKFVQLLAVVPLLVPMAFAQDEAGQQDKMRAEEKMKVELRQLASEAKVLSIDGLAMGNTVKGAPYSAVEVNESTQVLGDGTRIHNERQTTVYRDSEGRVRRETSPDQVSIWDPVAKVSYIIDPKAQTVRKLGMAVGFAYAKTGGGGGVGMTNIEVRTKDGITTATVNGKPVDPSTIQNPEFVVMSAPPPPPGPDVAFATGGQVMVRRRTKAPAVSESLGSKVIEGVNSEGTRSVAKLDVGAIGNDRPIEITNERWYSPELQTVMMTRHNDPRTGEEIFRLSNVNRAEPPAYLFQVPPGYQVIDRK